MHENGATFGGKNTKFLITGANSFVGQPLYAELLRRGQAFRAAVRAANVPVGNVKVASIGSIGDTTDWTDALRGVNVMRDDAADPLAGFRKVNRVHQRPHEGALYYERRRFYTWEEMVACLPKWHSKDSS